MLRDSWCESDPEAVEDMRNDTCCFLLIEAVDRLWNEGTAPMLGVRLAQSAVEIDIGGGHRLGIGGDCDPEALAPAHPGLLA